MLSAHNLKLYFGDRLILDDVSLTVLPGERVALVGQNGAGKSSLLRILAGDEPDSGNIELSSSMKIGFLQQTPNLDPEKNVVETVREAMAEQVQAIMHHQRLCEELALSTHSSKRYKLENEIANLSSLIEHKGGFDIDFRVEKVLSKLSIKARTQKIASLSGGEKRRVDLARILLSAPDIYLLDEPTNHLDLNAIAFLVETFSKSKAAVLFVSHDSAFVDEIATRIVELSRGKLYTHEPPYANYLENKLVRELIDQRSLHRRERLVVGELAWLRAGTPARTTKQNARIERAHALIDQVAKDEQAQRARKLEIERAGIKRLGHTIIELSDIGASYGDRVLFNQVNLKVGPHQRYGIIGPNGSGKTTFLAILAQKIKPTFGEIKLGKNTLIMEFDQQRQQLNPEATLKETLADHGDYVFVGDQRIHIASYLEKYLFDPSDANRRVGTLSGGEQNRLLLAKLFRGNANCLLLDEPTNDLDVTSLAVLEELVQDYEGVVFVVSHDRRFLDKICNYIIAFEPAPESSKEESRLMIYAGNYTTYLALKSQTEKSTSIKAKPEPGTAPKAERIRNKTRRSFNEEREYLAIEGKIDTLEKERAALHEELASPDHFRREPEQLKRKADRLEGIEREIEVLYARWQELSELD